MTNKTCILCGACCKIVYFPSSRAYESEEVKDWLSVRGIKQEDGLLKAKIPCEMLTEKNQCAINETKPKVCRDFVPGSDQICPLYAEKNLEKKNV
ncbi:MAG: YkgJ family cysteine cluster protein [Gammaproteobacteria bacterium]|nr:YkgJ family cysteine cluster protein [Gammaproteobacteria bacterium]